MIGRPWAVWQAQPGWQLPVKFTKLATGGNCVVGCHREMTYDRESPVKY